MGRRTPSEVDRLLMGTAENYYAVVNTFVRLNDLRDGATDTEADPDA